MRFQLVGKNLAREADFLGLSQKPPFVLLESKRLYLSFKVVEDVYLFVFKFGVVVFVNFNEELEREAIKKINPFLIDKNKKPNSDNYFLEDGEAEEYAVAGVKLPSVTYKELGLAARILAQSVEIDYFDQSAHETLKKLKESQKNLERHFVWRKEREYIQNVSVANAMASTVVVELSLLDKPSILWVEPKLQLFFSQVADVFEIDDRVQALQYKTDLIRNSSQFIIDIFQTKKSHF
ncbi:MAG: RMD1 family protein, partial [Candidatus Magasanikbacteria bacterium]|nr:RMD1 family protein [Candidatus Magasanikbacteria bacterium]